MILSDFHVHTTFCDGNNTPYEMVKQAVKLGMKSIGFSVHSYTSIDDTYCIKKEKISEYKNEICSLKKEFAEKIKIYCGVEADYYADEEELKGFDYKIGSVHYIVKDGAYYPIDDCEEKFAEIAKECFDNDFILFAKKYYETVSDVVQKTNCDIIGHFDLIAKFNKNNKFFDEQGEEYINIVKETIDNLLKFNKPFEINTGAISRGYRTTPYPIDFALEYILNNGGKVVLSSDAHSTDNLMYNFYNCENKVKEMGFKVSDFTVKE